MLGGGAEVQCTLPSWNLGDLICPYEGPPSPLPKGADKHQAPSPDLQQVQLAEVPPSQAAWKTFCLQSQGGIKQPLAVQSVGDILLL